MTPLYEAKMLHQFDHRWAAYDGLNARAVTDTEKLDLTFAALPRYWVAEHEVDERLQGRWDRPWLLGWRRIARSTDERTVIAAIVPRTAAPDKFALMMPAVDPADIVSLLDSLALDFLARQKGGGTQLDYFLIKQLAVLLPQELRAVASWDRSARSSDWVRVRFVELIFTSYELEPFARDLGDTGAPFKWNPERRFLLRAELDAAFFHLYGIARDDVDYILDTFPITRRKDETGHGEYRTKRMILEVLDAMQSAVDTGEPYRTILDPPPGEGIRHTPKELSR